MYRKTTTWILMGLLISAAAVLRHGEAASAAQTGEARAEKKLSYPDLLSYLTDLNKLPEIEPGVYCRQFSSYDRRSRIDEATGQYLHWEANGDAGRYLRIDPETKEGVMAEMDGPGCIVRIWSANPQGLIRFYFDGDTKPTYEWDFAALFSGKIQPFIPPLVWRRNPNVVDSAADCYLPIPFARSCKVTSVILTKDGKPSTPGHYYHIDYRTFPKDWQVNTFKLPLDQAEAKAVQETARRWASPTLPVDVLLGSKQVQAGESFVVLERSRPGVIRKLFAKLRSREKWATRKVMLKAYWDGAEEPAINCPIGDFFGEPKDAPYRSYPMGITPEFNYCLFPMPFHKSAKIVVVNDGKESAEVLASFEDEKSEVPENWGLFHAKYRQEKESTTFDYPFVETTGAGKFVGVCLFPDNIHGGWWGEGDEKVWVDGEKFPSWFGTGSEDYFGDAWGIQHFANPSHGHPQKTVERMQGCYRWHIADSIPFYKSFRMTIENYAGLPKERTRNDYYSVAYWYQLPQGSDFFKDVPVTERIPRGYVAADVLEAEDNIDLPRAGLSTVTDEGLPQELSRGRGVKLTGNPGDTFTFKLPVENHDRYRITLGTARGVRSCRYELLVNGRKVEKYAELNKGQNTLTVRLLGEPGESRPCEVIVDYYRAEVYQNLITDWIVIGPFPNPDGKNLDVEYPPEKAVDVTAQYAGREGSMVRWQKFSRPNGIILLNDLITPKEHCVVYGACVVQAPKAGGYKLLLGSDDAVKVWINGTQIWRNAVQRAVVPDSDRVEVSLNEGPNLLLIKVEQELGDVGWAVRFLDPNERLKYALPE